ncbi:hypothetical protein FNF29_06975 [Cafeteria roenbergensis]|uniref:Uncharacterized protein n=1 Tax=Cafeteria roenbergensis TaxID=33653 RepID=A0A5A8C848_CAFRO|nr:hypothetical protein FNF29_06975 [Cafeteria roenbergensis]|eukprot:KAA0148031.1 hypothetical protein FNF29_06975 [Cafeteria roenbergensis]
MRGLILMVAALAAAAHARIGSGQDGPSKGGEQQALQPSGQADAPAAPFAGALGPDIPGLGGACKVLLPGSDAASPTLDAPAWFSMVSTAAEAGDAGKFVPAMTRLCGDRLNAEEVPFHKSVPADDKKPAVSAALGKLSAACSAASAGATDVGSKYASAFDELCPPRTALGPSMPQSCAATLSSSVDGRSVRMLLYLSEVREAAAISNDGVFVAGIRGVCGPSIEQSGAEWATHAPTKDSPVQARVLDLLDSMRGACGEAEQDPSRYAKAWAELCPASPAEAARGAASKPDETCDGTLATLRTRTAELVASGKRVAELATAALGDIKDDDARTHLEQAVADFWTAAAAAQE